MAFKVRYDYKPHTWEDGKYIDNDRYIISIIDDVNSGITHNEDGTFNITTPKTIELKVTEDELNELWLEIKKAVAERNDVRGYH